MCRVRPWIIEEPFYKAGDALLRRSTQDGRRRRADARPQRLARRRVTLTLAGPQRLNALSAGLNVQLQDRLDEIAGNPTIRSVVITGENRLRGRRPVDDAGRQPSSSRLEQRGRRQLIHGVGSAASSAASSGRLHRPTSCSSQRSMAPRRASGFLRTRLRCHHRLRARHARAGIRSARPRAGGRHELVSDAAARLSRRHRVPPARRAHRRHRGSPGSASYKTCTPRRAARPSERLV